ncbi:unnamed protein product [Schistocephalus solidus]|uniref:DIX domain-containing protein n=1 Tax=Schistocephalus solidus TaxID=70667 RepID=A0A183SR02_SCHSO|nr:unnamed protein product [Schistocephalus solidus]
MTQGRITSKCVPLSWPSPRPTSTAAAVDTTAAFEGRLRRWRGGSSSTMLSAFWVYFFKTASDEFGTGVVHEEIGDDNAYLPLWEGKVIARVERAD